MGCKGRGFWGKIKVFCGVKLGDRRWGTRGKGGTRGEIRGLTGCGVHRGKEGDTRGEVRG